MPAKVFVIVTLEFRKEAGYWLGRCRELGTATDGRSLERVKKELMELVLLHLNGLEDTGERDQVFRERGIKMYTDDRVPTEIERTLPVATDTWPLVQAAQLPLPAHHDRALATA